MLRAFCPTCETEIEIDDDVIECTQCGLLAKVLSRDPIGLEILHGESKAVAVPEGEITHQSISVKTTIDVRLVSIIAILASFSTISIITFERKAETYVGLFFLIIALLAGSMALTFTKDRKISILLHLLNLLLFGLMLSLTILAGSSGSRRQEDYLLGTYSPVAMEILALLMRFLPQIIGSVLILAGLAFPFNFFGLIEWDKTWKPNIVLGILAGLIGAGVGITLLLRKNEKAILALKRQLASVKVIIGRKTVWVPTVGLSAILIGWFIFIKPLLAPVPVDGRWNGKGQGGVESFAFTVEGGGRFATDVVLTLGPSGRIGWSIRNFPGSYEIKAGEFTIEERKAEIHAVFDSRTEASGDVRVEEMVSEPVGHISMPSRYVWEGEWNAQLVPVANKNAATGQEKH